jgi:hypothetical protein
VWYLLAEYALSEIMSDQGQGDEQAAGFLFQALRELGVPPEWIRNIESKLTGFAAEAQAPIHPGRPERSGNLRVFCQKRLVEDAHSANGSRAEQTERTIERAPVLDPSGTIMNGGWGYFIVERSGDYAGPSERSQPIVDLYLYKEGA